MNSGDSVIYDLPQYSPAIETPKYTAEPMPDERRLQMTRRVRREESGVFVEKTKHMTIALTNQVPDCKVPTYSRAAVLQGAITFVKPDSLSQVEVKLWGNIRISVASAVISGERDIEICDQTEVLYRKDFIENYNKRNSLFLRTTPSTQVQSSLPPKFSGEQCPATLVFALQFPHTYQHEGVIRMLPPSYSAQFGVIPGISLNITYFLKVTTVRRSPLGDKRSTTCVYLEYIPRSRPTQPSLPFSMTFLSTLKLTPEEWEIHENQAQLKQGIIEENSQLYFALAIPKSRIFPLTQPIPFHLQLLTSSDDLLAAFEFAIVPLPAPKRPRSEMLFRNATRGRSLNELGSSRIFGNTSSPINSWNRVRARISVSIERSVSTETHGEWVTTKQTLTTQQLELSPDYISLGKDFQMKCLALDGQLQFRDEYHCGAFSGPGFRIKDFLCLAIYPPDPESSLLRPVFYSIPVRISTDPYTDEIIGGMELIQSAPPLNGRS